MSDIFIAVSIGFLGGLVAGGEITARKWAANADAVMRTEWRGRLYKVEHAE